MLGTSFNGLAQRTQQPVLETRQMSSTLWRRNNVHETAHGCVVTDAPTQRHIDNAFALNLGRCHVAVLIEHGNRLSELSRSLKAPKIRNRGIGSKEFYEVRNPTPMRENLLMRPLTPRGVRQAAPIAHHSCRVGNQ